MAAEGIPAHFVAPYYFPKQNQSPLVESTEMVHQNEYKHRKTHPALYAEHDLQCSQHGIQY